MPKFTVNKPCRPNTEYKAPGDEVSLTEAQAKYLLMSGHLTPKNQEPKSQESMPQDPKHEESKTQTKKPVKTKKADA